MAELITIDDAILWQRPTARVYTRARWGDDWSYRPEVRVDRLLFASAPGMSQAQLSRRYGELCDEAAGGGNFVTRSPLNLERHYVRIDVDQIGPNPTAPTPGDGSLNLRWHGYVEEPVDQRSGRLLRPIIGQTTGDVIGQREVPIGQQIFGCLGMEALLAGVPVRHSYVRSASGGQLYRLERALVFNDPVQNAFGELVPRPNRSAQRGPHGAYLFTDGLDTAEYWTTPSIVEYLLTYFSPRYPQMGDLDGDRNLVPFALTADSGLAWPQGLAGGVDVRKLDRPVLAAEGRKCFECLSALLDRRRLLGWTLAGVDSAVKTRGRETVRLHVFRFNAEDLLLEQGVLVANPRRKQLRKLDQASGSVSVTVRKSHATANHRLIVRGGRNRAIFGLSLADATLAPDWLAAAQQLYDAGASAAPNYELADLWVKEQMNQRARSADILARVYRRFKVPATFDGLVAPGVPYFGPPSADGLPTVPFYLPGWRFLRRLPLKPPGSLSADDMPLLVFVARQQDGQTVWDYGQRAASEIEFTGHPTGRRWSVAAIAADDGPALELDVQGGPQHVIARDVVSPLPGVDVPGELDYRSELGVTVAVEIDQYCQAEYRPAGWWGTDALREEVLDLGPIARRDWIAKNTPTAVDAAGQLVREPEGRFVRDDTEVVQDLATIAGQWYARPRMAVELELTGICSGLTVGDLLESVGGELAAQAGQAGHEQDQALPPTPIGAVVTSVDWQFAAAPGQGMRTRITTDYAELDLVTLAEYAGLRVHHSGLRQSAPSVRA